MQSLPISGAEGVPQQSQQQPMNRRERRSRFDQKAGPSGQGGNYNQANAEGEYGRFFGSQPDGQTSTAPPKGILSVFL